MGGIRKTIGDQISKSKEVRGGRLRGGRDADSFREREIRFWDRR